MLKIKDNVDLKELEKFGFYKSGGVYQLDLETEWNLDIPIGFIKSCIYIQTKNRIVRFSTEEATQTTKLDKVYDLIKADLVEKVD